MLLKLQSAVAVLTCGCLVSLAASPSSIGFVVTNGEAMVDGARVPRTSTLFQGSLVQAGTVTSDLMLPGGANLLLQPGSSANVYDHYAVLRRGTATERGGAGYVVVASGLRVSTQSPGSAVIVSLRDRSHLEVTAEGAGAEVHNAAGGLVGRLEAGKALGFSVQDPAPAVPPQAATPTPGAAAPAEAGQQLTLHGILRKDHAGRYGHYLLTDLASHVSYELQGPGLDDLVGGSVEVTGTTLGTTAVAGATRVLSVFDIHQMTIGEMTGGSETAEPNPPADTTAAAPPAPSDTVSPAGTPPETAGAAPNSPATPGPAPASEPPPSAEADSTVVPAAAVHSDTAKIILIVALAAGAGVGVALGLAGGKTSTVSPE